VVPPGEPPFTHEQALRCSAWTQTPISAWLVSVLIALAQVLDLTTRNMTFIRQNGRLGRRSNMYSKIIIGWNKNRIPNIDISISLSIYVAHYRTVPLMHRVLLKKNILFNRWPKLQSMLDKSLVTRNTLSEITLLSHAKNRTFFKAAVQKSHTECVYQSRWLCCYSVNPMQ